jgi:hypothetical protein
MEGILSFFKRLTIFILIPARMIMFLGLLPGIARSARIYDAGGLSTTALRSHAVAPK